MRLVAYLLLLGPVGAAAETAYVGDRLLLGIHETKTLDSAIIKLLPSGTAVDLLERDGPLARVRSRDLLELEVETLRPVDLTVDRITLFESVSGHGPVRYQVLHQLSLQK